ncbi:poly(A)-specific ribonuclease, partial [Nowakowskiella sp. JEL0407]
MSHSSSPSSSEVFLSTNKSGLASKLEILDLFRGVVTKQVDVDSPILRIKRGRLVSCGTLLGKVELRDPRSFGVEHLIDAHGGTLTDMDISGNTMITCGFSQRQGQMIVEPLVKVYDLRTLKALPPISFLSSPSHLKFHPKLTSTVFTVSSTGQFQICDLSNPTANIEFYQVETDALITCFDVCSSGEAVAFGLRNGQVSLWTEKKEWHVNSYSRSSVLPDPVDKNLPRVSEDSPLNIVGMPYYTTPLFSGTWPSHLLFDVGRAAPRIPPEVIPHMKLQQSVAYAPNQAGLKRNQQLYTSMKKESRDVPKFRSEQERAKYGQQKEEKVEGEQQEQESMATATMMKTLTTDFSIPKRYKKIEILYSRFGIEDFDFGFYNKTPYAGLETHILNSYSNSMLQVLYFNPGLQQSLKHHTQECLRDVCLSCELSWLFKMLQSAKGMNCQANNFLRTFGRIPQASALGLFEVEQQQGIGAGRMECKVLIQNFTRFLLEQMHQELMTPHFQAKYYLDGSADGVGNSLSVSTTPAVTPAMKMTKELPGEESEGVGGGAGGVVEKSSVEKIYGIVTESSAICSSCNLTVTKTMCPFVVDLSYKKINTAPTNSKPSFVTVLHQSLSKETNTKAWCVECKKYQPSMQLKVVKNLPGVLTINVGLSSEDGFDVWRDSVGGKPWLLPRVQISVSEDNQVTVVDPDKEPIEDTVDSAIYDLS